MTAAESPAAKSSAAQPSSDESPAVVLASDHGSVRLITLNRPRVRNAIDIPLRLALADRIDDAAADPGVRAIVLTGAGSAFCAGGDISTMRRMSPDEARPRAQAAQRVIRAMWGTPKPVVAAVEGAAFGAGASLALACDRIVAGEGTRMSMAFTGVGLAGDMGIFASLPARVGPARAKQLLLMPRVIDADEALSLGLIDRLTARGVALESALDDARTLAGGPLGAFGAIKSMLAAHPTMTGEVLDMETDHQVELFGSDDFAEGVAAFAEKRRPRFGP